jgi:hypothetical protein
MPRLSAVRCSLLMLRQSTLVGTTKVDETKVLMGLAKECHWILSPPLCCQPLIQPAATATTVHPAFL